jgi:hypothetical protein
MMRNVANEFFRVIGFFCTVVISYAFVKSAISGKPPKFPLSGDLLAWIVLAIAALVGAYMRQRTTNQ